MKPIAILEHSVEAPAGYLGDAIMRAGLASAVIRLYEGDRLPDLNDVSGIVSLGGKMGAYDEDKYDFLGPEKELLRQAVARDIPVLGICLGCQILADALGGSAYPASAMEVEFAPLEVVAAGLGDPVVGTLAEPVLSFHGDTWDPPPGAEVLAYSRRFPHAFRLGSAVAVQSHPEVSATTVRTWVDGFGRAKLEGSGINTEAVLQQLVVGDAQNEARAEKMFHAWLDEVISAHTVAGDTGD
jgi:GMP synthase (glutamine-hydrolysing)